MCVHALEALTSVFKARGSRRWDEEDNREMLHYLVICVVPHLFHVRSNCSGTKKSSQAFWHSCPSQAHTSAVQSTRSFCNATGPIAVCQTPLPVPAVICSQVGNTAAHFITTGRPGDVSSSLGQYGRKSTLNCQERQKTHMRVSCL